MNMIQRFAVENLGEEGTWIFQAGEHSKHAAKIGTGTYLSLIAMNGKLGADSPSGALLNLWHSAK